MKLITQLFFFFSLKNENHERQNFIHWWSLKILWVSYTLYTLSFLDFLEFLIKWIYLVLKSVWLLLWVEKKWPMLRIDFSVHTRWPFHSLCTLSALRNGQALFLPSSDWWDSICNLCRLPMMFVSGNKTGQFAPH